MLLVIIINSDVRLPLSKVDRNNNANEFIVSDEVESERDAG